MKAQLSLPLEQPLIERLASRLPERAIYYMARREWVSEYTADHAIKQQRKSS